MRLTAPRLLAFAVAGFELAFAEAQAKQVNSNASKYKEFAKDMDHWGYTWEPFELTTDDDYILTTFRITGRVGHDRKPDERLNPVLMMHG